MSVYNDQYCCPRLLTKVGKKVCFESTVVRECLSGRCWPVSFLRLQRWLGTPCRPPPGRWVLFTAGATAAGAGSLSGACLPTSWVWMTCPSRWRFSVQSILTSASGRKWPWTVKPLLTQLGWKGDMGFPRVSTTPSFLITHGTGGGLESGLGQQRLGALEENPYLGLCTGLVRFITGWVQSEHNVQITKACL